MGNSFCSEPIDFSGEVELSHFELLRSVGKGAFGKVRIVQKKDDKKIYALKYINKQKCINMKAVNNIIQERRLLEDIDHPLIVNLRYAFQDDENMFMVIDLMLGGDLRFHLDRQGSLKEEVVRFYIAECAVAINYLHSKRIVHRDLKPDNVLLDEMGHAHLTDFNIAVRYTEGTPLKSVAGSMAYMAPEVLAKKGYFASPDWWSLGIVMYELLFGKRPFRGRTNDALTSAIQHDKLHFPPNVDSMISQDCQNFLKGLLERDLTKRLGASAENWNKLMEHPWFTATVNGQPPINWEKLCKKEIQPPFTPDNKRANFDATHELEELLLEENPLRVKKRSAKKDYSKIPGGENGDYAKSLDIMEKKFLNFNFERKSTQPDVAKKMSTSRTSLKKLATADAVTGVKKPVEETFGEHSMHDLVNFEKDETAADANKDGDSKEEPPRNEDRSGDRTKDAEATTDPPTAV